MSRSRVCVGHMASECSGEEAGHVGFPLPGTHKMERCVLTARLGTVEDTVILDKRARHAWGPREESSDEDMIT